MAASSISEVSDLLKAIASVLWVGIPIAALIIFRRVILDGGSLSKLGLGPSGVTMEFAERKLDEALDRADDAAQQAIGPVARRTVVERVQRLAPRLAEARILWVDDHPENNTPIRQLLESYGATVDAVRTNDLALQRLRGARYDVVISDVGRDDEEPNSDLKGLELAEQVIDRVGMKTILFTGRFDPARVPHLSDSERLELVKRVQRSVFGMTNRTDEVLHLVLDVLDR